MTEDTLISLLSVATRVACQQMTTQHLKALHDSAEYAFSLPARPQGGSKAAAHAEMFTLLADVADHPVTSGVPGGAAHFMRELILTVGPAADGMIISSRRRLLAFMGARHADEAALDMESISGACTTCGALPARWGPVRPGPPPADGRPRPPRGEPARAVS